MPHLGSEAIGALSRLRRDGQDFDLGRLQAALSQSDDWWHALFHVAGIGMVVGTMEGELLAISPAMEELFGYSAPELKKVGVPGVTHPDDLATDEGLFRDLVAGKQDFYQLDKRYIRKDGSLMWGRLTVVLLRDEKGTPCFFTAMVEDITALKQASEYEARMREAELSKKQALELNDDVLQELVVAKLAFDSGETEKGREALAASLAHLKRVIDHMLAHGEDLAPGDFVRGSFLIDP